MGYQPDLGKSRQETIGENPKPPTLFNDQQLAWPGMMVEIGVTAMLSLK